ncbi:MAG: hypothetical protein ABSC35_06375 [Candidatus Dormibacteria bacterium]|jgi:hypothetical protein
MSTRLWVVTLALTAAIAACGSSSGSGPASNSGSSNSGSSSGASGGSGVTESLTLSGALQGEVTYDNGASSLGLGRAGCTKPDLSSGEPFGILFLGHLPGQADASLEINIAQSASAANVASPHVSLTFPDAADSVDINVAQGSGKWGYTASGTLSINLSGATETGAVDADVQGSSASGATTQIHVAGNWSCPAS